MWNIKSYTPNNMETYGLLVKVTCTTQLEARRCFTLNLGYELWSLLKALL